MKIWRLYIIFLMAGWVIEGVLAQSPATPVQCGTIIDGEFSQDFQLVDFTINMAPGDKVDISASALGDQLQFAVIVLGPTGLRIAESEESTGDAEVETAATASFTTGILSARGTYTIRFGNGEFWYQDNDKLVRPPGGVGVFTLYVGCTLRDGTEIAPGDVPSEQTAPPETVSGTSSIIACEGLCFPGLPSADLNNVARLPLIPDTPMTAALTPTGSEIYGFMLDATAEQKITLTLNRISGNLNIAVIALTPDNRVAQALILTTTNTLTTDLTFTMDGQYTFAVFRVDMLSPAEPQPTILQITGALNP